MFVTTELPQLSWLIVVACGILAMVTSSPLLQHQGLHYTLRYTIVWSILGAGEIWTIMDFSSTRRSFLPFGDKCIWNGMVQTVGFPLKAQILVVSQRNFLQARQNMHKEPEQSIGVGKSLSSLCKRLWKVPLSHSDLFFFNVCWLGWDERLDGAQTPPCASCK